MPDLTARCGCTTWHHPGEPCLSPAAQAARHERMEVLARASRLLRRGNSLGPITAPVVIDVLCTLLDDRRSDAALVVLRRYVPEETANRILDTLSALGRARRTA